MDSALYLPNRLSELQEAFSVTKYRTILNYKKSVIIYKTVIMHIKVQVLSQKCHCSIGWLAAVASLLVVELSPSLLPNILTTSIKSVRPQRTIVSLHPLSLQHIGQLFDMASAPAYQMSTHVLRCGTWSQSQAVSQEWNDKFDAENRSQPNWQNGVS